MRIAATLTIGFATACVFIACSSERPKVIGDFDPLGASGKPGVGEVSGGISAGSGGAPASSSGPQTVTGTQVDARPACDGALPVDGDATAFANSIGICATVAVDGFGLSSASYSRSYGQTAPPKAGKWGILPKFGNVIFPREGSRFGALSTGFAREYDNANGTPGSDFVDSSVPTQDPTATAPPGFPKAAQGCQQDGHVNDMIDVRLVLRAPADATGFQFDFDFYSSEWPNFVCSNFNDAFVAYITSNEKIDNVSFDSKGNPVSVNNAFFDRCTPNTQVGCAVGNSIFAACPGGPNELSGTGFGTVAGTDCNQFATDGGATGWLTTQAAIKGGELFTLELMIWNAGDEALDSSVLIDNFKWLGGAIDAGTIRVN